MKIPEINCEVNVDNRKAMRQVENIKAKLIELSDLIDQVNKKEIIINVSVTTDKKKWYQFWK